MSRAARAKLKRLEVSKSTVIGGALGTEATDYAPQVAMGVLMAGALVIFMMYGMGIWLGKPREVRSWHRS